MLVDQSMILDTSAASICWSWMIPGEWESCPSLVHTGSVKKLVVISVKGSSVAATRQMNLPVRVKASNHKTILNLFSMPFHPDHYRKCCPVRVGLSTPCKTLSIIHPTPPDVHTRHSALDNPSLRFFF